MGQKHLKPVVELCKTKIGKVSDDEAVSLIFSCCQFDKGPNRVNGTVFKQNLIGMS